MSDDSPRPSSDPPRTDAVRERLCTEFPGLLESVRDCAVASTEASSSGETDTRARTDTAAVRRGIEQCLRRAGVWEALPRLLAACVDAAGGRLRATPVAAPPYVAPTATGVVLRATLDGGRLVVALDALAVDRTGDALRLEPRSGPLEELLRVEWHPRVA